MDDADNINYAEGSAEYRYLRQEFKTAVPDLNITIYCHVYSIENLLRELIIEQMDKYVGPKWPKQRLPVDVCQKYKTGIEFELNIKWTHHVPHHPIYYIEFSDLKKVIDCGNNWDEIFAHIFNRKDIFISTLSEIEVIRNKVAHSRKTTIQDLEVIRTAHCKLLSAIGINAMKRLSSKCTEQPSINASLAELLKEMEDTYHTCTNIGQIMEMPMWLYVKDQWWFDNEYIGSDISPVSEYYKLIEEYCYLDRQKGKGYIIEQWVQTNNLGQRYFQARETLNTLLTE